MLAIPLPRGRAAIDAANGGLRFAVLLGSDVKLCLKKHAFQ
jgi:hypothetical protein